MRPALLAVAATALLATGTVLSLHALQPPAPSAPAAPEAVAAAPPPAVNSEIDERSVKAAAAPVKEPTAPTVVRVKTVRIEPERPLGTTEAEQAAAAADVQQQEAATANDQPAMASAGKPVAALSTATPEAATERVSPRPRVTSAHAKSRAVVARSASRAKRKVDQLAGDDVAKDPLSYAPRDAGPESLNPLGKLLSGR